MALTLAGDPSPIPAIATTVLPRSVGASKQPKVLVESKERKMLTIYNHSSSALYIDFGASVSTNNFAVKIPPGAYYDLLLPNSLEVRGVWAAANGKALIREFI